MDRNKIFACQKCDENIEIEDVYNTDTAVCHNCGQSYTVRYVEREEAWELIAVESVEERQRQLAAEKEDESFQVLREPAAPRKDDIERFE